MSNYELFSDHDPWADLRPETRLKAETTKTQNNHRPELSIFGNSTTSSILDSAIGGLDSLMIDNDTTWGNYNSSNIINDNKYANLPKTSATHVSDTANSTKRDTSVFGDFTETEGISDQIAENNEYQEEEEDIDTTDADYDTIAGSANIRIWNEHDLKYFKPLSNKNSKDGIEISVKEIPEKEGLVFKHINYLVSHTIDFGNEYTIPKDKSGKQQGNELKVIRRYSDFTWLVDVLWKKYPMRLIPELPPKQFGLASANDALFLQKRRRGLQRFLYQLCKHPILSKEKLTIMFLTVPNDFSNWRKFANIELNDEFDGVRVNLPKRFRIDLTEVLTGLRDNESEEFETRKPDDKNSRNRNEFVVNCINQIWNENPHNYKDTDFMSNITAINGNLSKLAEIWAKLYSLVERIEKREFALAIDHQRFGALVDTVIGVDTEVFGMNNLYIDTDSQVDEETQNLTIMNTIIRQMSKYFTSERKLKEDEMSMVSNSTLESWKMFQDYLISLHFLIERFTNYKIESEREIQELLGRIMKTTDRIKKLKMKSDITGSEIDRNVTMLTKAVDQLSMSVSRIILVKINFVNEYNIFQKVKYLISEVFQDWFDERGKYFEKRNDSIQRLFSDLKDMPLGN